jgi:hypothetical protein
LNQIELTTLLKGELKRITLQLSRIIIKIKFLNPFIFYLLTNNSVVPYRLHDFWYRGVKESKKICKRKSASKLEVDDDLEGFQTIVREYIQHVTFEHFM